MHDSPLPPRPIFIVGSPRSGTSILTWCLGQHPNILPLEESGWIGPFAVSVGTHHAIGCARGERSQLSALGVESAEFFRVIGTAIDRLILSQRECLEQNNWLAAQRDPRQVSAGFSVARGAHEPKARWVDGTPENSLYICGLRKLFPGAKFVHAVRDASAVVASMLGFRQSDGTPLVTDEEQAWDYWLRTTQACVLAEQALGVEVIHRLRYADLVQRPEWALRNLFEFLDEPYAPAALEPLAKRINSSAAEGASPLPAAQADSELAQRALRLSAELEQAGAGAPVSAAALAQFEAAFAARMDFYRNLDTEYQTATRTWLLRHGRELSEKGAAVTKLKRALNWCGILLLLQLLPASALVLRNDGTTRLAQGAIVLCWAVAMLGVIVYAWLRRAGVRAWAKRLLGG